MPPALAMSESSADWYSDWRRWSPSAFAAPTADDMAYCDAELAPLLPAGNARILEVGFGNGPVLGWCRARGHRCAGVESSATLAARGRAAGFEIFESLAEALDKCGERAFDLVLALDVLEHIEIHDLPEMLKCIRLLSRDGAAFVARFPNGDSPFGRAYQHGDVTHVTVIGSEKIAWLAGEAGFRVERVKEPAVPLKGAGVLRAAKRLSGLVLRRTLDKLISHAYFAGAIRVFSASVVVVLRAIESPKRDDGPERHV